MSLETYHTRIIMDSGKEYVIEKHPEDVVNRFANQLGVTINGFIFYGDVIINPSHVSSIEYIKVTKSANEMTDEEFEANL